MADRFDFVVHLRRSTSAPIVEVSGTFVGNYVQAFAHIQGIARQYDAEIVAHTLRETGSFKGVVRTTQQPLALPPPPAPAKSEPEVTEEPTLPEGCEWATVEHYETQEYTNNGNVKASCKDTAHRLH